MKAGREAGGESAWVMGTRRPPQKRMIVERELRSSALLYHNLKIPNFMFAIPDGEITHLHYPPDICKGATATLRTGDTLT